MLKDFNSLSSYFYLKNIKEKKTKNVTYSLNTKRGVYLTRNKKKGEISD